MNINAHLKANPRSCKYGAPMGAADWLGDPDYAYKFYLQRLTMTDGCYTLDGTYWGGPTDLWCAWCPAHDTPEGKEDDVRLFMRAPNRDKAKALVLDEYPNAKFFR